ncbi:MAG: glutamine synthetase beta-grasp domain-containing protein, partial [Candidatus Thermoplasmatota archaeon]|nr:glutamine synthetase beta-grasp domain-containing protein [Candidatus Thermoplasmatota archaeon]
LRVVHIPVNQFIKNVLTQGLGFDGSSVGIASVEKSDMIALPDTKTFLILPHEKNEARIIANIFDASKKPFNSDPRYILKKAKEETLKQDFDEIRFSPEMEFYVFNENENNDYENNEKQRYFSPSPLDEAKEFRKTLSEMIIKSNYNVKYHHHESGKYQHEVEINALDVVDAADYCVYFKYLCREIASLYKLVTTFMPKPLPNDAGSGMHAHVAFYKNKENKFYDEKDPYKLSQTARYFIGGILEHARGMAAIANPTLNSYKRLIPNFQAPIYIAWARYNRSSLIRIAAKNNVDVEIRNADPAANPYLLFAAILYAGLDGIKKKIQFEPIEKNIYKMGEEFKKLRIKKLPTNLLEALEELEKDDVIKKGLGKESVELFIEKKKKEWQQYIGEITDLEYKLYFNC